jgi:hypothetical protein
MGQEWKDIIGVKDGSVQVRNREKLKINMDSLIAKAVFEADEGKRKALFILIKEIAKACSAIPSSIQGLYEEMGREYPGFTVPAINIRGLT